MLDNVLTVFIKDAPDSLEKAKFSAMRERSVGLGAMGFHAYLQKNKLSFVHPFDDPLTIAGQGTIGKEILEDDNNFDVVFVPVGGGFTQAS